MYFVLYFYNLSDGSLLVGYTSAGYNLVTWGSGTGCPNIN